MLSFPAPLAPGWPAAGPEGFAPEAVVLLFVVEGWLAEPEGLVVLPLGVCEEGGRQKSSKWSARWGKCMWM